MGAGERKPGNDALKQVVGWVVDHILVDANFEGVGDLLIGDANHLAMMDPQDLPEFSGPWQEVLGGYAIRVAGPTSGDGPFVWVLASSDGPVATVNVVPDSSIDGDGTTDIVDLQLPSGIIAIGSIRAIQLRRTALRPHPGKAAEFLTDFAADWPDDLPIHQAWVVVAECSASGTCTTSIQNAHGKRFAASFEFRLPRAPWVPDALP